MLSIDDALKLILERVQPLPPVERPVAEGLGLLLAEDIVSDIDSPPHDKSLVDGYAVVAAKASTTDGRSIELQVVEEVAAGAVPTATVTDTTAIRIFTGAPIPNGADAVVMLEHCSLHNDSGTERVQLLKGRGRSGQNIMRRGQSLRHGDVVLRSGSPLRAIEIGLLAEVGRSTASIFQPPKVAILATGNELVPPDQFPIAGQIRNSNGPMLAALVRQANAEPINLGIATDDPNDLRTAIERGLLSDVLILSGGVSAGGFDLVPQVLQTCGVQQVFHKVNLKPGKPLWFGTFLAPDGTHKLVFGLPGNPVSTLVCFEVFVRPALTLLNGRHDCLPPLYRARLAEPFVQRDPRPTYFPAFVEPSIFSLNPMLPMIHLLDWKGSADLRTLANANCFAVLTDGERIYEAGEEVGVMPLVPQTSFVN